MQNPYQEPDQECIPVQVPLRQNVPVPAVPVSAPQCDSTAEDQNNSLFLGIVEDFSDFLDPDHH
jgi:hypothetical protein